MNSWLIHKPINHQHQRLESTYAKQLYIYILFIMQSLFRYIWYHRLHLTTVHLLLSFCTLHKPNEVVCMCTRVGIVHCWFLTRGNVSFIPARCILLWFCGNADCVPNARVAILSLWWDLRSFELCFHRVLSDAATLKKKAKLSNQRRHSLCTFVNALPLSLVVLYFHFNLYFFFQKYR